MKNIFGLNLYFFYHDNVTTAVLVNPENNVKVGYGEAYCSQSDNFNRAIGRKVALKRAINHLPKDIRTKIWEDYFNTGVKVQ